MDMAAGGTRVISRGIFLSCPMLRHTQAPGGGDARCGVPWGGQRAASACIPPASARGICITTVLALGSVQPRQLLTGCWESSQFIYQPEKWLKVYCKGKEETLQGPRAKPVPVSARPPAGHRHRRTRAGNVAQTSLIPRALCSPGMKPVPGSFPCFHHHHRSVPSDTGASSEQEGLAQAPCSHHGTQGFSSYKQEALSRSKILLSSYKYLKQKFVFVVPVCRDRCFLGVSLTCGSTQQPGSTSAAELGLREALGAAAALGGSPDTAAAPLRANPQPKGRAAPTPALPAAQHPHESFAGVPAAWLQADAAPLKNSVPQGTVTGSSLKGGWKSRRDHSGPGKSVRAP